jgi:preprotein translocase subunit Sec61beta
MASKQKNAGFQQAAGLIRYFDAEEETAIHIDPRIVLVASFLTSIAVLIITWAYPLSG